MSSETRQKTVMDRGWARGPAIVRFTCDDCERPVLKGEDAAARNHGGTFTILHGACLDIRRIR